MARDYCVYILASARNGTLYVGVTGDLPARLAQHRSGSGSQFTRKNNVARLVHVERFADIHEAIAREKALKKWRRAWKLALIERGNPQWLDLFEAINA
jgi:putative endonuclease